MATEKVRFGENKFIKVRDIDNRVAMIAKNNVAAIEFSADRKVVKFVLNAGQTQWLSYNINDHKVDVTWI